MNTRKKIIKTVYKDENDSEEEPADFSDSGSEAKISEESSTEDEEDEHVAPSLDEFIEKKSSHPKKPVRKPIFAKSFLSKIHKQTDDSEVPPTLISVKDLSETDKLLPPVLNLSESDSSDDESPKISRQNSDITATFTQYKDGDSDDEAKTEYKDVFSHNIQDNSEEIAHKTFLELQKHQYEIENTKASVHNYTTQLKKNEFDVRDLLAQGEDVTPQKKTPVKKKPKGKKVKDESDSEIEDWEEVQETKAIPQQGIQLVLEFPDAVCRKSKKLDVEMMMKRKINRVKKEYQVYMHKVHVLCWLGHGNYVSRVLNDQELLAASLSLVPGKECYPGERVDLKYLEQITMWYKDKLTLKQDKNENKFRPKAPPLKDILLNQIKGRVVTTRKYLVFIFVAMLRALGLQCRVMFNFVTLPLKPPSSELCSLSTKPKDDKDASKQNPKTEEVKKSSARKPTCCKSKNQVKIPQYDGNWDSFDDSDYENIMQVDGGNDTMPSQTRSTRTRKGKQTFTNSNEDESPPKKLKKNPSPKPSKSVSKIIKSSEDTLTKNIDCNAIDIQHSKSDPKSNLKTVKKVHNKLKVTSEILDQSQSKQPSPRKTRSGNKSTSSTAKVVKKDLSKKQSKPDAPTIILTEAKTDSTNSSKYFETETKSSDSRLSRKRSNTANPTKTEILKEKVTQKSKNRTKSAPGTSVEKSKYFDNNDNSDQNKKFKLSLNKSASKAEDKQRISHRDIAKNRAKPKNDVTNDLVNIIKERVKEAKEESKKGIVKGKIKPESDVDSDFLPEEEIKCKSESDDDFKPSKISPKPSTSRQIKKKIDRRVLSSDEDNTSNKIDVWCEVYVEELEQWVSVNVIKAKVHCSENIYTGATHPVCYVVGWDNNNYMKDLTRRYVPHWNTVTRKQRVESAWWDVAIKPWLGPKNARDKEEDEQLDRMQLEAPLPKSIAEYKNHPLYALKRHLLKFEAIYPPDAATLGFIRGEAVYARDCVYTCRSRDTWLKEAKVVRLGEQPYKVVKARPKWDKLSNKLITDKPLEVFGPWQVQDYEPPIAENGIVPRNAYGNVELFKDCMLPKGTVHLKLPGLNKVAKKLNIDCAPAMTGFDFNGGWSHPVYDGFVVCKEFEDIITEAWVEDQEAQERKEQEKTEARVYGNWRRLIKGLLIRERLKHKYGFEEPSTSKDKKSSKGPRLVVTKKR